MAFDPSILEALRLSLSSDRGHIVIRSDQPPRAARQEYSFGIEEEYFLADSASLQPAHRTPNELFEAINWATGGQATREMLQMQVEVVTNVHSSFVDAREELRFLRRETARVAAQYGLGILACGTHPLARWKDAVHTPKQRYDDMMDDLRMIGQRNMLCGMHVHVELPDPKRRFEIMRRMTPYIPLFIALATSSPFWGGSNTGLKGYRLAAYDELPRTGLPELFTEADFDAYVDALKRSGAIEDASHVWWSMRPSLRHPTLELRAPDCCTLLDHAIAIAALYRVLARRLFRTPGEDVTALDRAIADENKWRAQRYGAACAFVTRDGPLPIRDWLDDIIEATREDAETLECEAEVAQCRAILDDGSSADRQIAAYKAAGRGRDGVRAATRWIMQATMGEGVAPERSEPAALAG